MIAVRRSDERGFADHGWLKARHTFSFAGYRDREHMGFGPLRVINEDEVAPGRGFATHPHDNMEIVTYVLEGALRHDDSTGGGGTLRFNDVQAMTAGSGLTHSEKNGSTTEPLRLIQIWIKPRERDLPPAYADRRFDPAGARNALQPIAAPAGVSGGALPINQDATISRALLDAGAELTLTVEPGRRLWLHVVEGEAGAGEHTLSGGDALSSDEAGELRVVAGRAGAHLLVFDLP
jgi:hypothetical protein